MLKVDQENTLKVKKDAVSLSNIDFILLHPAWP